jgi:hypothetical protein
MKQNGLWVIAFVIVALMVLTSVSPLSMNRTETIDNSTYIISNTPPDNPELGDLWFDTTLDEMNIYNGYVWQSFVPTVSGAGYQDHAAKHWWGGVDPIEFHKLSPEIRVASEFATSGSGTVADPYINGIKNCIDKNPNLDRLVIFLNGVHSEENTISVEGYEHGITVFGTGNHKATIISPIDKTLFEIGKETYAQYLPIFSNFRIDASNSGTEPVFKCYAGCDEIQMYNVEIWGCYIGIQFLPIEKSTGDHKLINTWIAGGTSVDGGTLIDFTKQNHPVTRITIENCLFAPAGKDYKQNIMTVEDYAITDKLTFRNNECRINDGSIIEFKGNISTLAICNNDIWANGHETESLSRHFYFHSLDSAPLYPRSASIYANQYWRTGTPYYFVWIGEKHDYINIINNQCYPVDWQATSPIHVEMGANKKGRIINNAPFNPFGVITNPFDTTNDLIHLNGSASVPSASTDYAICLVSCRIISTDSSNTDCSITIKDKDGNTIESGLSTYDNWLEPEWTINWGAFTGTAPTVTVVFK